METILEIADVIWRVGGAVVIILIVVVLFYILRLVLIAKGIVWWVKKSVETAQQSILSPMSMFGSFFSRSNDEFDDEA